MCRLAIFASGNGSNAQRIIEHFSGNPRVSVGLVLCNREGAPVIGRAGRLGVRAEVFGKSDLYETGQVAALLEKGGITHLILAGFLWLIPAELITRYPGRIINIHPALLPKYGGKGMYGRKVHEAVIASGDAESGITIHQVNERYDDGGILFQARCRVEPGDTAETLAARVHELEYRYFPGVIEKIVSPHPIPLPNWGGAGEGSQPFP
jgi:phosphoribosylglycinamide formyltransferase-1